MINFLNRQCLVLISMFFILSASSQTDDIQFGKIDNADLTRTFSTIDKNAEAEVLYEKYDVKLVMYGGRLEINIKAHTRIKIYNEKGLEEANIKIPYIARAGAEGIFKLEGQTYNSDASGNMTVSKLDKKSVYNKKINNRISNQIFTFPEVKAGSIVEYSYTLKRTLLYFDDWTFQRDIPVRYSNCTIEYPSEFNFSHVARTTLPMEYNQKQSGYAVVKTFTMRNLPALKDEPYISCDEDYLQQVQFHLSGYYSPQLTINLAHTWTEIIKEVMEDEDFGLQLKKSIPKTVDLDEKLKTLKSEGAKMAAIHNYVRNNMTWDENYSIWASDGVKNVWADKKGNSGEINLILVDLLKDAGLKAYPLLVSTRKHGRINTLYPDLDQFNTVMALVMIDSSIYVLDGTDKETPSYLIPERVMYTEGLLINKMDDSKSFTDQDFGWISIFNNKQKFSKVVNITAEMNSDGKISGQAFIMNSEYARLNTLKVWKAEKEKFKEEFTNAHVGLQVTDFTQKNEERDSLPLEHTFKFEVPTDESGEYRYFSVSLFSGLEKNPFIADERVSDITFGVNQKYSLSGVFTIPEGYVFEELPKNLKMVTQEKDIIMTRVLQANGNKVNYSIVIEFVQPFYVAADYDAFREFNKKMHELLNEQIVIRKVKS